MTEKPARKQSGRPFPKGVSGNPAGKPKGARHKLTILAEQLMEADAEAVVRKVIDAAKAGDMTAARLILERIAPPRKGRPIQLQDLPEITKASDVLAALAHVVRATMAGTITPDEATLLAGILEANRRSIETADLETRIAAIEAAKEAG